MIEQLAATKKMVAPGARMSQLSRMRRLCLFAFLAIALGSCGMPAPYQTYAPNQGAAPPPPTAPIIVYGTTTTMPDMVPDATVIEPIPLPPTPTSAPPSNQVAICYSRMWNKPESIRDAAVQACGGAAAAPQVTSQGVDIDACPLLTPTKAVFACSAAKTR